MVEIPLLPGIHRRSAARRFNFSDGELTASSVSGVTIDGTSLTITGSGTYVLSGSCTDGSVKVEKDADGVTLVLNRADPHIGNHRPLFSAARAAPSPSRRQVEQRIYYPIRKATTMRPAIPMPKNAVIKCKDGSQVVLCGTGTLNLQANGKNGIKSGATTADGEASLTIRELTLNIDAPVNDAVNAEAALDVESGTLTLSAGDDALHCDYTLNIGTEGTNGPDVTITTCSEGLRVPP